MKNLRSILSWRAGGIAALLCVTSAVSAQEYQTRVVARGLHKPTGIAIRGNDTIYFTEVPTPGVSGNNGGANKVSAFDLETSELELVDAGDPEPTDITVAPNGSVFWTCTSAGVIVQARDVREHCDWNGLD